MVTVLSQWEADPPPSEVKLKYRLVVWRSMELVEDSLSKIEWKKQPNATNCNQLIQSIYPSLIRWRGKISRLIVPHPIKLIMKMRVLVYRRERLIFELFGEITR